MSTFFYLRLKKEDNFYHRFGCVALERGIENTIKVAFSICSPKDRFNSRKAKAIAFGRLKSINAEIFNKIPSFKEIKNILPRPSWLGEIPEDINEKHLQDAIQELQPLKNKS